MSPAVLDESSFDDFVSGHDTVVIGFVQARDAAQFSTLADAVGGCHPGVFFAQVHDHHHGLFDLFGLSGTAIAIFRTRIGLYLEPGLPAGEPFGAVARGNRRLGHAARAG